MYLYVCIYMRQQGCWSGKIRLQGCRGKMELENGDCGSVACGHGEELSSEQSPHQEGSSLLPFSATALTGAPGCVRVAARLAA